MLHVCALVRKNIYRMILGNGGGKAIYCIIFSDGKRAKIQENGSKVNNSGWGRGRKKGNGYVSERKLRCAVD